MSTIYIATGQVCPITLLINDKRKNEKKRDSLNIINQLMDMNVNFKSVRIYLEFYFIYLFLLCLQQFRMN